MCLDKATIPYVINFYVWKLGTRLFYIRNDEFFNTIKNQHSFELNIQKLSIFCISSHHPNRISYTAAIDSKRFNQ